MTNRTFVFKASECDKGERLDVFLAKSMDEVSRSTVQRFIVDEQVTVNDKIVKTNYKIKEFDTITVNIPEMKSPEVLAEDIPIDVLYEDDDIIVINKARGMVVHPATGNYSGTLVNALLEHCDDLSGINGVARPGIVHRLDKDTSGVMIAAKSDRGHIGLAKQIKDHTANRRYFAIVIFRKSKGLSKRRLVDILPIEKEWQLFL
jgi:23S rRNA pseudouridine1911/1915/1917 synthase